MDFVRIRLKHKEGFFTKSVVDYKTFLEIKDRIESLFYNFDFEVVEAFHSEYEGFYEVLIKDFSDLNFILYASLDLDSVYIGNIIDEEGVSYTKSRVKELNGFI